MWIYTSKQEKVKWIINMEIEMNQQNIQNSSNMTRAKYKIRVLVRQYGWFVYFCS